jgi:hypothetical protein
MAIDSQTLFHNYQALTSKTFFISLLCEFIGASRGRQAAPFEAATALIDDVAWSLASRQSACF